MVRILMLFVAALTACAPSPQETDMPSPDLNPRNTAQSSSETGREGAAPETPTPADPGAGLQGRLGQGPIPASVSAAKQALPPLPADSAAEAEGRRTLSTAFVRVGVDGYLTVELRDGRVLVLRNVTMGRDDYCGVHVLGRAASVKFCGRYGEVATARPGGAPEPGEGDPAVPNAIEFPRSLARPK